MELACLYLAIVKIAIALALIGELKSCTLELLGLAAQKSDHGMISYSQYTRLLNQPTGAKSHDH